MPDSRDALVRLMTTQAVKRGTFTLASGRTSDIYVDARLTTMSPEGLVIVGALGLERLKAMAWLPDAIGGLTLGADPISYAISYASALAKTPIRAFTVRKEVKTHGTAQRIEGPFKPGDRVVIAEDVITSGQSAAEAIRVVRAADGVVVGVLALLDREEGGRDALVSLGIPVESLVALSELRAVAP